MGISTTPRHTQLQSARPVGGSLHDTKEKDRPPLSKVQQLKRYILFNNNSNNNNKTNMLVWRPNLPISNDYKPLTVELSDFTFSNFPYDRLPDDTNGTHDSINPFLRPEIVVGMVILYLTTKSLVRYVSHDVLGIDPKSSVFTMAVALHNFVLALFSLVVFVNTTPIVIQHYRERGMFAVYCDPDGSLWRTNQGTGGLGAWATVFYISKYYEFIDTWILIMKGKKASFLQTYHHAGIVLTMYGAVVSHSVWIMIVVVLNSFIHTLMYTYFFIKTLYPEKQIKSAKYLTQAQIIQFIAGIVYTLYLHVLGDSCDTKASLFVVTVIQAYAIGLIGLFVSFASKKYKKT